ncbi:DUF177 domain-containing protein [Thalassobacillus sp. CUG 92003]|uniref:YceD family protein n=1 Tax=Thalassobacillus sp. CUG 92003 TaxID=2736641 RepID=UPI0015E65BD1|nr:YceD family protein [Thalassobacillus sp. CUG 92003]
MKFPLQRLIQAGQEPYEFEDDVDVQELEDMNNDIRRIEPVHINGQATMHGEEITFHYSITGTMILPCARTLVDVTYPFSMDVVDVFSTSPYYTAEDDSEVHPVDGEVLDLKPYIKENVLLEVPIRVFSGDEQAYEQTPDEGEGWQVMDEEPEDDQIDPRMAKLQSLLNEEDNE